MALKLSGLVGSIKKAVVGLEGRVTKSHFYLTNTESGEMIQLCMPPEEFKVKTSANFRSYNVIEKGEVKIPKGERLTELSWSGILPGANILLYNFVFHAAWQSPRELVKELERWREKGEKIRVLITQTPVNLDVYIKNFDTSYSGGQGNIKYELDLIAAKEMQVLTVEEADARKQQQQLQEQQELQRRATNKARTGCLINQINNIWDATQILRGNGGDWQEIAERNGLGGKDPTDLTGYEVIWG